MENKLEKLLNMLIQRGRKPFGIICTDFIKGTGLEWIPSYCFNPHPHMWFPWWTRKYHRPSLRQIVSKESWLWQFVCENGMIYSTPDDIWWPNYNWLEDLFNCWWKHPDYWLMESALCDEYKLEDFLLSNIKVEW